MPYEVPTEVIPVARAYVYNGDWVADCPRPWADGKPTCSNVEFLYEQTRMNGPRDRERTFYTCSHCGFQCEHIAWPRRREEIMMALIVRPVPDNRNWYPTDHPVAIKFRLPHGQSIADLLDENEQHGVSNETLRGLR